MRLVLRKYAYRKLWADARRAVLAMQWCPWVSLQQQQQQLHHDGHVDVMLAWPSLSAGQAVTSPFASRRRSSQPLKNDRNFLLINNERRAGAGAGFVHRGLATYDAATVAVVTAADDHNATSYQLISPCRFSEFWPMLMPNFLHVMQSRVGLCRECS